MRRRMGIALALGIALGIAALTVTGTDAAPRKTRKPIQPPVRAASFCVSGEFTGRLEGWISLNGSRFCVLPTATIYEVGRGAGLPVGTMLAAQRVTLSGVMRGDSPIVQLAMVRPFGGGAPYETGESPKVGVLDESAPR